MKTIEELLKPRWVVIQPYPGSILSVGHIITRTFSMGLLQENVLDKYPHLFRKLHWSEILQEDDRPEYIKCIKDATIPVNSSSYRFFHEGRIYKNEGRIPLDTMEPSTEEEYLKQHKKQNTL